MHLRLFNKHGGHIHFNYEQNICTSSKNPNEERQGCLMTGKVLFITVDGKLMKILTFPSPSVDFFRVFFIK